MSSPSPSLPLLPLEVEHLILRFCDPSTLAKTAQVSLAFLELSSPILYEDVHVHGIEALKILFSERDLDSPPSPSIAPFLCLSQIRNLIVLLSHYHLRPSSDALDDLSFERMPSYIPIPIHRLEVSVSREEDENEDPVSTMMISLSPFVELLHPIHLCVRASPSDKVAYLGIENLARSRLESLTLGSLSPNSPLFSSWTSRTWPLLNLVTYRYDQEEDEDVFGELLGDMLGDLPMREGVQVVLVVGSEEVKAHVLETLRENVESEEYGSETGRVVAQITVEVKQRT